MRFSRQEYWSGLPFPPSGDLPNLCLESPAFAGEFKRHLGSPVHLYAYLKKNPSQKINYTAIQKLKMKKCECYWHIDKQRVLGMDEKSERVESWHTPSLRSCGAGKAEKQAGR